MKRPALWTGDKIEHYTAEGYSVAAAVAVQELLKAILGGPLPPGMQDTPGRVARALKEMTAGYAMDPAKILAKEFDADGYNQIVVLKDISFTSLCEHHLLPFVGRAAVAYIPKNRVVGLSKLARVVECFALRFQIQERMTMQIADAIETTLKPLGVVVLVRATHSCMANRGVRKPGAEMVTSDVRGAFFDKPAARDEVFRLLT